MKNRYFLLLISLSTLTFLSCSDNGIDDNGDNTDNEYEQVNTWIENTMRDYYYWYDEIPTKVNRNLQPESFFVSLLSYKDGKTVNSAHRYYSVIEEKSANTRASADGEISLGFQYLYYYIMDTKKYALKVAYILPDSPASKSELKRGDWIFSVNGESISDNIVANLNNGTSKTLGVASGPKSNVTKQVALTPATVEDNPVYLSKVYRSEGKKIGYLVYNHFTPGKNDNDETYNNSLRKAFTELKNNSVDEFILDLRYNSGGLITCAQLLTTMLAPSQVLGDVFCYTTYNDKKSSKNNTYKLDASYMQKNGYGTNLNLGRIFIITSGNTASASEAVINGIIPFLGDKVILVGETTEGKNVGSITLTDSRYNWELHPIVCKISNKNKDSDYENGFLPTTSFNCSDVYENVYDLGDENEYILNKVLRYILYNESVSGDNLKSSSTDAGLTLIGSSFKNKNTNGVLIK